MAYIGNEPAETGQQTSEKEIIATAAQVDFVLDTTVSRETDIIVSINGVLQPASAYTIGGSYNKTLSFSAPGLTLNDVLRVQHIGFRPAGTFGLQNDSVDIAHLSATGTPSASVALKGNNTWGQAGGPSLGTDAIIRTNGQTITTTFAFAGTENGMTAGPITIADTKTVTVTDGSTWTVF
jgi:hypothetical protein